MASAACSAAISRSQSSSSSSRTLISTLPRSAFETGQSSAACSTFRLSPARSRSGTRALTVSAAVVIRGAPSTSSSAQAAVTVRRLGGVWFSPRTSASAIAKQLAWAAAISSSGLVLPSGRSVRDAHVTGSSSAPLPVDSAPTPRASVPSQITSAVRCAIGMVCSFRRSDWAGRYPSSGRGSQLLAAIPWGRARISRPWRLIADAARAQVDRPPAADAGPSEDLAGSAAVGSRAGGVERDHGVGVGASGAHFGGDPDRLHDLRFGGALAQRDPGMAADAVRALGHVRDRHRDQLLRLFRQRAVGEDLLAERLERLVRLRRELRSVRGQLAGGTGEDGMSHFVAPAWGDGRGSV